MAQLVNNLFTSARFARDLGSIPGWGRSPEVEDGTPTPVFLPGKLYGQRSLVDYSQWGCKVLDTTEKQKWRENTNNVYMGEIFKKKCSLEGNVCFQIFIFFGWQLSWGANGAKLPSVGLWLNTSKSESCPCRMIWQHCRSLDWPRIAGLPTSLLAGLHQGL